MFQLQYHLQLNLCFTLLLLYHRCLASFNLFKLQINLFLPRFLIHLSVCLLVIAIFNLYHSPWSHSDLQARMKLPCYFLKLLILTNIKFIFHLFLNQLSTVLLLIISNYFRMLKTILFYLWWNFKEHLVLQILLFVSCMFLIFSLSK